MSHRGSLHTAILEFLECGRGRLGGLDEFEVALGAIDTLGRGSHDWDFSGQILEKESRGSRKGEEW